MGPADNTAEKQLLMLHLNEMAIPAKAPPAPDAGVAHFVDCQVNQRNKARLRRCAARGFSIRCFTCVVAEPVLPSRLFFNPNPFGRERNDYGNFDR